MLTNFMLSSIGLRYYLDSLLYNIRYSAGNRQLEILKNICPGKPILVIGNGPSLNKTPLKEFAKITAIGMNKINLLFDNTSWRPNFIVCTNNLVIRQNRTFFRKSDIPVFLSWKGRWFLGTGKSREVGYFLSLNSSDFSRDLSVGVGSAGTVTYTALQFAYYMGADPVILFGVDHSFNFEGKANEIVKMKGIDPNHFDPNYFANNDRWGLPNFERIELAYRNAKAAFEGDNRKIYDATIGGKLQIFEKISVERAKQLCGIRR